MFRASGGAVAACSFAARHAAARREPVGRSSASTSRPWYPWELMRLSGQMRTVTAVTAKVIARVTQK